MNNLVRPERLELPTLCSEGRCSIQLSYGRTQGIFYGKARFLNGKSAMVEVCT
jgi:hypothetical protein